MTKAPKSLFWSLFINFYLKSLIKTQQGKSHFKCYHHKHDEIAFICFKRCFQPCHSTKNLIFSSRRAKHTCILFMHKRIDKGNIDISVFYCLKILSQVFKGKHLGPPFNLRPCKLKQNKQIWNIVFRHIKINLWCKKILLCKSSCVCRISNRKRDHDGCCVG